MALVARSGDVLGRMAAELGGGSFAIACDLADAEAVRHMTDTVAANLGDAPDIVVNNAGVFELAALDAMNESVFVTSIRTNVIAPFLVMHAFVAAMRERGSGHLVSIGSIADRTVMPENGAYSAAKYGLRAMHEVLRLELRGTGVRNTLVSPGAVDTPIWDVPLASDHTRSVPTRSAMLSPEAVAQAVLYALEQPDAVNIDELRLSHA